MADILLYLVTVLIWGSTWFAITFQLGEVPIEWSLVYRFGLAAALMLAFCALTGRNLKFPLKVHLRFMALGLLLFSTNYFLIYEGTKYVPSGLVAVLFSTMPLMNIANGVIFLKRQAQMNVAFVSLVGLTGIALIFWPELEGFSLKDNALLGLILVLLATWSASSGNTVASTDALKKISVIQTSTFGMLYGTLLLTAFALAKGAPPAFDPALPYVASLAYLTVFGTIVAFTCYFLLIKRISMERAAYITVAFPLVALAISTAFEGYRWTLPAAIGMVLVLGGNYFVLKTRERRKLKAKPKLP